MTMTGMGVEEPLRERLVSAGVGLLEQVGAGQLGLRAIARETGVSHGAPRRYFPTHNALLAAVAARGYADLKAGLQAAQGNTAHERVEHAGLAYLAFAVERPEMFTLMFRHDLLEGAGEDLRRTTTRPLFGWWRELVAAAADDPTGERALNLWTNLHGIATVTVNRSIEAIAPGADTGRLVAGAVARHLA